MQADLGTVCLQPHLARLSRAGNVKNEWVMIHYPALVRKTSMAHFIMGNAVPLRNYPCQYYLAWQISDEFPELFLDRLDLVLFCALTTDHTLFASPLDARLVRH